MKAGCCETGYVCAGCNHDRCTGPKPIYNVGATEYTLNPNSFYALYRVHPDAPWRLSANVTNTMLRNADDTK